MSLGRDDVDTAWLGRSPGARDTALGSERCHGEAVLRRVATWPGRREEGGPHRVWHNHLGKGFIARINLSDSWRSENTINTHKYNTIYWSLSRNYYNLSSRINYTEDVWSQNYASNDKSEFAEAISLNSQNILFALKENVIHQHSKPEDPSTESNHLRFGLPTDNPHRHHR
jgi:hypothetical protein